MNDRGDRGMPPTPRFVPRVPPKIEVRRTVQVAKSGHGSLLIGESGGPIWPARNEQDREALASICEVLGGSVEEVREPAIRDQVVPSRDELVLGIGEVEEEARLYAHLSGPVRVCAVYINGFAVHSRNVVTTADSISSGRSLLT